MEAADNATPLAATTPNETKPETETRDPKRCNTTRRDCRNRPMPAEFYCEADLHPHRMRPHAEKAVELAMRQIDFLKVGIAEADFAPATQLLSRAEISRDAERWHDAFRWANQSVGKALELKVRPIVTEALSLWNEYGFLEPRLQADFHLVSQQSMMPRPNWNQISVQATKLRNTLRTVKATADRNRQIRLDQAEQARNRQAEAKRLREEREATDKAEREARAAQAMENVGVTGSGNTGQLSLEGKRELETMSSAKPPKHDKNQKKSKDANNKVPKGKNRKKQAVAA